MLTLINLPWGVNKGLWVSLCLWVFRPFQFGAMYGNQTHLMRVCNPPPKSVSQHGHKVWCRKRDSNSQHPDYKTGVLPIGTITANLVDPQRIELWTHPCKGRVFPIKLQAHIWCEVEIRTPTTGSQPEVSASDNGLTIESFWREQLLLSLPSELVTRGGVEPPPLRSKQSTLP